MPCWVRRKSGLMVWALENKNNYIIPLVQKQENESALCTSDEFELKFSELSRAERVPSRAESSQAGAF